MHGWGYDRLDGRNGIGVAIGAPCEKRSGSNDRENQPEPSAGQWSKSRFGRHVGDSIYFEEVLSVHTITHGVAS